MFMQLISPLMQFIQYNADYIHLSSEFFESLPGKTGVKAKKECVASV